MQRTTSSAEREKGRIFFMMALRMRKWEHSTLVLRSIKSDQKDIVIKSKKKLSGFDSWFTFPAGTVHGPAISIKVWRKSWAAGNTRCPTPNTAVLAGHLQRIYVIYSEMSFNVWEYLENGTRSVPYHVLQLARRRLLRSSEALFAWGCL